MLTQEGQQYAEESGLLFMETSAKTAMNVNDIFLAIGWLHFLFGSVMFYSLYVLYVLKIVF